MLTGKSKARSKFRTDGRGYRFVNRSGTKLGIESEQWFFFKIFDYTEATRESVLLDLLNVVAVGIRGWNI